LAAAVDFLLGAGALWGERGSFPLSGSGDAPEGPKKRKHSVNFGFALQKYDFAAKFL
jgi:hypothetical protein